MGSPNPPVCTFCGGRFVFGVAELPVENAPVQKALEEEGIEHEIRTAPHLKRRRAEVLSASGQATVPVIEFADGTGYRVDGKEMAAEIRAGRLFEHRGDVPEA